MTNHASNIPFAFGSMAEAVAAMCARLKPVAVESLPLGAATGRVLGESLAADRPSPPCDVSAMDGYAVRLRDIERGAIAVLGEAEIGRPTASMPEGAALRIFTGAPVPAECDAVIPREGVVEHPGRIELPPALAVEKGQHIRRRGENGRAGEMVVASGVPINGPIAAALATFGVSKPRVHRRLRLGVLVTGNEIRGAGEAVEPWQIRDSNGPALAAMFARSPWIDCRTVGRIGDDSALLEDAIGEALDDVDALLLTGGVSMGDYDFVPAVLRKLGCEIVFHKLPIRPGKPVLGAIGPAGRLVLGLPGNPVSVMSTGRCIAAPILRHLAGHAIIEPSSPLVRVRDADDKRVKLQWLRPVRYCGAGEVELVATRGSGDIIAAARSDGIIDVPPNQCGPGPWPFHSWSPGDG